MTRRFQQQPDHPPTILHALALDERGVTFRWKDYRARDRAWLQLEGYSYSQRGNRTGRG